MRNSRWVFPFDQIGMCTSVVCILHCLSIPLFLLFGFDAALRLFDQEWVEWSIIAFGLVVGMISFMGGFRSHRQHFIPVLFVAGFLLLVSGDSMTNAWASVSLSVAGASIVAYAHVQNLRWKYHAAIH